MSWKVKPLSEACEIKPPKSEARRRLAPNDMVSFVPMEDLGIDQKFVRAEQDRALSDVVGSYTYFADGDVLLAKITPCFENGKLGIAARLKNGIGFGSSEFIVLRPRQDLDSRWLYYFLSRDEFRARGEARMGGAVGHKRVAKEFVESYQIPIPPLPEQHRIVALLDEAFAGITTAKANVEKSLRCARELIARKLHSLFVKNDDWEMVSLEELLSRGWITSHLDGNHGSEYPRKDEFVDSGVPYIAARAIKDGSVDFGEAKYLSTQRAASIRKGLARDRDVLFAHNATVGPVAILRTEAEVVILGTSLTYYRCDPERLHPEYLAHYMRSPMFTSQYAQVMKQSTRNQVPITKQREFFHLIPPVSTQRQIAESIDELSVETEDLVALHTRKLVALDELKQSLLQRAFSGQL